MRQEAHDAVAAARRDDGADVGVDFVEMHDLSRAVPAHIAGLRRLWIDQLPR